jgi:hypothetical protein
MPGVEERVMASHLQSSGCTISTTVATLILRPISSQLPDGTGTLLEMPLENLKVRSSWQKFQRGEIDAVVVPVMGRFNRLVAVDVPHHITQRG